jgi:hypothetical protein
MEIGIKPLHHFLPFMFYIVLVIATIKAFMGKIKTPKKDRFLIATLALAHIQLILGVVLLMPFLQAGIQMGNAANRFVTVEHPLMMIIAVVLITIGKVKAKKTEDVAHANKIIFYYFFVALVFMALRTPWDKLF